MDRLLMMMGAMGAMGAMGPKMNRDFYEVSQNVPQKGTFPLTAVLKTLEDRRERALESFQNYNQQTVNMLNDRLNRGLMRSEARPLGLGCKDKGWDQEAAELTNACILVKRMMDAGETEMEFDLEKPLYDQIMDHPDARYVLINAHEQKIMDSRKKDDPAPA